MKYVIVAALLVLGTATPATAEGETDLRTRMDENKCVDIYGFNNSNGARAVLWDCTNGANQKWQGGTINGDIRSAWNNKCLTFLRIGNTDSGNVAMYDCDGGINQQWHYDQQSETLCTKLISFGCLMLTGAETRNGNQLMVWPRRYPADRWFQWYWH